MNTVTESELKAWLNNHPNMKPVAVKSEVVGGRTYSITSYKEQLSGLQRAARIIAAIAATIFTGFIGLLIPGVRNLWKEGYSGEKKIDIKTEIPLQDLNQNNVPLDQIRELDPSVKKIHEFKIKNPIFCMLNLDNQKITQRIEELDQIIQRGNGADECTVRESIFLLALAHSRNMPINMLKLNDFVGHAGVKYPVTFPKWISYLTKAATDAGSLARSSNMNPYTTEAIQNLSQAALNLSAIVGIIKGTIR